jgi:hypothetical protein
MSRDSDSYHLDYVYTSSVQSNKRKNPVSELQAKKNSKDDADHLPDAEANANSISDEKSVIDQKFG